MNPSGFTIRAAREADIAAIRAIYAHYVLHGLASFEIEPPGDGEMLRRFRDITARRYPFIVAETGGGAVAGYAYANSYRPRPAYFKTAENSVYVSPDHLGRGVGRGLLEALIQACTQAGFRQMVAVIGDSENHPSINLHLKCGFARVGLLPSTGYKHGRWVDSVLMQRALGPGDTTPPD